MANRIENSPITFADDPSAWRSIPEVPFAVQDAFGPKAEVVLHQDRWRGLVPGGGGHVFAWLDGRTLRPSGVRTSVTFGQTLESDADGRALVIGGAGGSLLAVDPSGAAACLGDFADEARATTACWLRGGGVAVAIADDICVYTPGPDGRLLARLRFAPPHDSVWSLRSVPCDDPELHVLVSLADDRGAVHVITSAGQVHTIADFDRLDCADVRQCLDETGKRMLLPDADSVSVGSTLAKIAGLSSALARLSEFPLAELTAAPELVPGEDIPAPEGARLEVRVAAPPDAAVAPKLDRLGRLTTALITMLRAAPRRSTPDPAILKLIRVGMPVDLRAYVHAWACHAPNNPTVYEFWMAPPRLETREFIREHAGESLALGTFASGEPIVARLGGGPSSCEVVMIDEEGQPYRYRGLEGFLRDLQMRCDDSEFELDAWLG